MKSIVSVLLATILLILPLSGFATENDMLYGECSVCFEDVVYMNQQFGLSLFAAGDNLESRIEKAISTLTDGVKNFRTPIDISQYRIPTEYVDALFSSVFLYNPELFYMPNTCRYIYSGNGTLTSIVFSYAYTPQTYAIRKQQFDLEVSKITALIKPGMSELEKALIIHDYIDLHCKYDTEVDPTTNKLKASSFRADGIIIDKVGVCQSYSMAYYYIMNLLDVEADYAESTDMNHLWNIFKIGDNWYHVDSTWDDPTPDGYAYVDHTHFLASDDLISQGNKPHYNWVANHKCSDTSLDNHFWRNIKGAIAFDGNHHAYYHTEYEKDTNDYDFEILTHDLDTHQTSVIKTIRKSWPVWDKPNYRYLNVYSDVSFFNGKLYFNTPTEIIEMNTDGSDEKVIAEYTDNDGYIYGSMLDEPLLVYGISTKPRDEYTEYHTSLINRINCAPSDENSDSVNVSVLRKYLDYKNMPGKILASLYDENDTVTESIVLDLSKCSVKDENSTIPVDFKNNGKYIKLMWWDMNTLSPISESITLNI